MCGTPGRSDSLAKHNQPKLCFQTPIPPSSPADISSSAIVLVRIDSPFVDGLILLVQLFQKSVVVVPHTPPLVSVLRRSGRFSCMQCHCNDRGNKVVILHRSILLAIKRYPTPLQGIGKRVKARARIEDRSRFNCLSCPLNPPLAPDEPRTALVNLSSKPFRMRSLVTPFLRIPRAAESCNWPGSAGNEQPNLRN